MGKQSVAYPHNGLLFAIKSNEVLILATVWTILEHIMLSEKKKQQT